MLSSVVGLSYPPRIPDPQRRPLTAAKLWRYCGEPSGVKWSRAVSTTGIGPPNPRSLLPLESFGVQKRPG